MSILDFPTPLLIGLMVLCATVVGRVITVLLDHTVRRERPPQTPRPRTLTVI